MKTFRTANTPIHTIQNYCDIHWFIWDGNSSSSEIGRISGHLSILSTHWSREGILPDNEWNSDLIPGARRPHKCFFGLNFTSTTDGQTRESPVELNQPVARSTAVVVRVLAIYNNGFLHEPGVLKRENRKMRRLHHLGRRSSNSCVLRSLPPVPTNISEKN